jgi:hypothetical protein
MFIRFPVILSAAKACPERGRRDLMPVAHGDACAITLCITVGSAVASATVSSAPVTLKLFNIGCLC